MKTKSGYVVILGLPNSGKSTLMNALLGQKLSITTRKPQTTRRKITGILSGENYQVIFLDTPGILKPAYLLQEKMADIIEFTIKDADVILFLLDLKNDPDGEKTFKDEITQKLYNKINKPVILVLSKVDLSTVEQVKIVSSKFEDNKNFKKVIPVASPLGYNLNELMHAIIENLPEHPKYYPDDNVSDENERFFVSEIIREKILELYSEEIPYSCEVVIYEFKEREKGKDLIQAEIIVEKESQKGIIIGKKGAAIKKLGEKSRVEIEEFLQRPVFLELRVKVRENWRSDEKLLKSFGYSG
jgi:GTPase